MRLEPSLWNIIDKFQRLDPKIVGLSPELQAEVEGLEAERNAIEQRCDEPEDYSQEDDLQERREIARLDEIEDRLESIASGGRVFTDEQKAISGVLLGIGHDGQLVVHRGLAQRQSKSSEFATNDGEPEAIDPNKVSSSLQEELTAQRTVALRAELLARPYIALVAITHRLAGHFCYSFTGDPLDTAVMIQPDRYGDRNDLPEADRLPPQLFTGLHCEFWCSPLQPMNNCG